MPEIKTNLTGLDILSDDARAALEVNRASAYEKLVVTGEGNPQAREMLMKLSPSQLLNRPITRPPLAQLLLSGLWLWHDWLSESHVISQKVETPDGSYWHAIMHRREGDFSNSKYWLARCRAHPVGTEIAAAIPQVISVPSSDRSLTRLTASGWDPFAFVDLAEQLSDRPDDPLHLTVVAIQRLEWQTLFAYCARLAIA
jgi:hypothetical protein